MRSSKEKTKKTKKGSNKGTSTKQITLPEIKKASKKTKSEQNPKETKKKIISPNKDNGDPKKRDKAPAKKLKALTKATALPTRLKGMSKRSTRSVSLKKKMKKFSKKK